MRHLNQSLSDATFPKVSPLYQLMGSHRTNVRPSTLLAGLDAGWAQAAGIDEQDPDAHRSVLLTYLGTFAPYAQDRRPDATVTQGRLDAEALAQQARPGHGDPVDVAMRLLDLGADPFLKDVDGRDALDQVVSLQWTAVLDRLLALDDARTTPAALAGRSQHVWRREARVTGTQDGHALPWLHAAAAKGRLAVIEHLLDHGMDVNQRDAQGRTLLFYVPFDDLLERLLARGADPTVRDRFGDMANAAWPQFGVGSDDLKAMNARFLAAYRSTPGVDTAALQDEQRAALFQQAVISSASTFQAFQKSHGFSHDETMDVDGHAVSLLAHTAMHGLNAGTHSPAIASGLVSRAKNLRHESVPGVPDVVLVWLFVNSVWQGNTERARLNADQAMGRAFGWGTPGGFERSLDEELLPLFERLLTPMPDDPGIAWLHQRTGLREIRCGIVRTLERSLAHPSGPGAPALEASQASHAWWSTPGPTGTSRAWRWAALSSRHHGQVDGMEGVFNVIQAMSGGTEQLVFKAPPDADAVLALMGILGYRSGMLNSIKAPECEWGKGTLLSALHHLVVERRLPVDSQQPGFAATIKALQDRFPMAAQAVERRLLEEAMVEPETAPSADRRRARL